MVPWSAVFQKVSRRDGVLANLVENFAGLIPRFEQRGGLHNGCASHDRLSVVNPLCHEWFGLREPRAQPGGHPQVSPKTPLVIPGPKAGSLEGKPAKERGEIKTGMEEQEKR